METNKANNATTNPETQPAKEKPAPRPRDPQDRAIANGISGAKSVITMLKEDTTVRDPLARRGYDQEEIDLGFSLQIAAQTTFNERQKAMGEQEEAADAFKKLVAEARASYADFRRIARKKFKTPADRTKLGLVGAVPNDLQQFSTIATTSYTEAGKEPYLTPLAKKGYGEDELADLLTGLDKLDKAAKEQKKAAAAAQKATKTRDTAYGVLKGWIGELRETAKVAFRKAPEQARKLDF
jgi:hypothetical protein